MFNLIWGVPGAPRGPLGSPGPQKYFYFLCWWAPFNGRHSYGGGSTWRDHNLGGSQALGAMVEASALDAEDATRLTALVQSGAAAGADADDEGAPAAAAYEGQSGGIVEMLEGSSLHHMSAG